MGEKKTKTRQSNDVPAATMDRLRGQLRDVRIEHTHGSGVSQGFCTQTRVTRGGARDLESSSEVCVHGFVYVCACIESSRKLGTT